MNLERFQLKKVPDFDQHRKIGLKLSGVYKTGVFIAQNTFLPEKQRLLASFQQFICELFCRK